MREFLALVWAAIISMWVSIVSWFAPAPIEEMRIPPTQEFVGPVAPRKLFSPEERECLALNIYFEARNQTPSGQLAVAMVVLNRAEDSFWPDNVCDVVKQGSISQVTLQDIDVSFLGIVTVCQIDLKNHRHGDTL